MTTPAISHVTIAGTELPAAKTLWDVTITHGRPNISDVPQASRCTLTAYIDPGDAIPASINDTLNIKAHSVNRFTGTITDVTINHDTVHTGDPGKTRVTITAAGNLRELDYYITNTSGFSTESLQTRATAILDDTSLTYSISADTDPNLIAEDADPITSRSYLEQLCLTLGATLTDLPDGAILMQEYARRADDYAGTTWASATGSYSSNTTAWGARRSPIEIPAAAVEWEPIWQLHAREVVNDVTIAYGTNDPKDTVTDSDSTSISTYGTRSAYLDSPLANSADATTRAGAIITAQANPRWNLNSATIRMDDLATGKRDELLAVESGDRVIIDGLPKPSPDTAYLGVVEGWTETHNQSGHKLTLYLSDPRYSYATAAWSDVSGTLTWGDVNTYVTYYNVITADDLVAA